jgi:hypothetical protein
VMMHMAKLLTMKGMQSVLKRNGSVPLQSLIQRGESCRSMLMTLWHSGTGRRRQGEQMQVSEICCSLAQWNHINQDYCIKRDHQPKEQSGGSKSFANRY